MCCRCSRRYAASISELRQNTNRRLRQAAGDASRGLIPELQAAASSSATPQARIVAASVRIKSDRLPAVQVGGSRRIGHRRTPAGRLLWGSEVGGRNFAAPTGGAYWIAPTVDSYARRGALEVVPPRRRRHPLRRARPLTMAPGISNVVIKIGAETAGAVRGITQVNKALGEQATTGQKASSALKKAAVPAGIAFAAAGAAIMDFTTRRSRGRGRADASRAGPQAHDGRDRRAGQGVGGFHLQPEPADGDGG